MFAEALITSGWREFILDRHEYKGYPFPPLIWHTTLCRYKRQFFPVSVRKLFENYKNHRIGSLSLDSPALRAINYD